MPLATEAEALAVLADSRSSEDIMSAFLKNNFETYDAEGNAMAAEDKPRGAASTLPATTPPREGIDGLAAAPPPAAMDISESMNSQAVAAADVAVRVAGPATPSRGVSTLGRAAPAVDSLALYSGRTGSVTQLPPFAGGELVLGYGSEHSPMPEVGPMGTRLVSRRQVLLLWALDGSLRAVSIGRNPSAVVTNAGDIISLKKGTVCCPSRN